MNAKKLYRVSVTVDLYVAAETEEQAERWAREHAGDWRDDVYAVGSARAWRVTSRRQLSLDVDESYPWNDDPMSNVTCGEMVG